MGLLGSGPTRRALNSCMRERESPEYRAELGAAITTILRTVPDGVRTPPSYSEPSPSPLIF